MLEEVERKTELRKGYVKYKSTPKKQRHRKRILNKADSVMIEKYSFGEIVVNGVTYTNDIKAPRQY